jgi:hypothetical protein
MGVLIRCRVELGGGEGRGMRRGWNGSNSRTRVGDKSKFLPKSGYVDTENTCYMCFHWLYVWTKNICAPKRHVTCFVYRKNMSHDESVFMCFMRKTCDMCFPYKSVYVICHKTHEHKYTHETHVLSKNTWTQKIHMICLLCVLWENKWGSKKHVTCVFHTKVFMWFVIKHMNTKIHMKHMFCQKTHEHKKYTWYVFFVFICVIYKHITA